MQLFHYDPATLITEFSASVKKTLPRSRKFRKRSKQTTRTYVEVTDFIPAEYQFMLIKRLFESLLISKLFSSSNLKWVAFSIFTICFILLMLCWGYFLSQDTSSVEVMQWCGCELFREQIWKAQSVQHWGWNIRVPLQNAGRNICAFDNYGSSRASQMLASLELGSSHWLRNKPYQEWQSLFLSTENIRSQEYLSNIQIKCSCLLKGLFAVCYTTLFNKTPNLKIIFNYFHKVTASYSIGRWGEQETHSAINDPSYLV